MSEQNRIYDFVMEQFKVKRVRQRVVAESTGIPYSTVTKIAQGHIKDPSVHTVQALADFFTALQKSA